MLYMSALQGYLKGALRKKQLVTSFVEQFKLNFEKKDVSNFSFMLLN